MIRWVVMIALASCGGTEKRETPIAAAPSVNVLGKLEDFRAQMCACNFGDKACASKVRRALGDFNDAHRDASVPYHETKRLVQVGAEIERCEKRAEQDDLFAAMYRFRDAMCACAAGDKDCAMRVQQDMQEYAETHREGWNDKRMTDDDMKKATDIGMAMAKCSANAMGMGTTP